MCSSLSASLESISLCFPVVWQSDQQVPVVDFGKFWTGSQADRLAISRDVAKAFKDIGFMYISNYPIDQSVSDKVFQEVSKALIRRAFLALIGLQKSSDFFALSNSIKDQLAWRGECC